jgi:pimeloyl-ACP methyl ester carboxylesterase
MNRILYLHGFASGPSSSKARFFRDRLQAAGATVDVPDLAAGDFEHLTLTSQLSVIERAAQGEPVSLIGSSMGGYLAALYARRHPEVDRLILLAPAFRFGRRWHERYGQQAIEQWRRRGTLEVFHYAECRQRNLAYDLIEDAARYEDYPDFRQPALIFHGAHDEVVPAGYSEEFAATHPNARLEVLDAGHELLNVLEHMSVKATSFLLHNGGGT